MIAIVLGLAAIIGSEVATLAHVEPFWSWNTPITWTGFILFADGIVWRARGRSWLRSAPREFAGLALASIALWLVFEGYNLLIENWYYTGLPDTPALRYFGYAWSFATIWPAIFEGAELVAVIRGAGGSTTGRARLQREARAGHQPSRSALAALSVAAGAAMLLWPIVRPSPYLAAPVWLGFIFLLDPINRWLGGESLGEELQGREYDRLWNLAASGLLCGILWEFWNYWSKAKWHYTVPIMPNLKVFEMPVPGYLGFPPFAIECFTMYVSLRLLWARLTAPDAGSGQTGHTIGL